MKQQVFTNREEWLKAKETTIGGSEIAAAEGIDPYTSPMQLYYRRIGEEQFEPNDIMRAGSAFEEPIYGLWLDIMSLEGETKMQEIKTVFSSTPNNILFFSHDLYPECSSSPDKITSISNQDHVIEVKYTAKKISHSDIYTDALPWIKQLNYNMGISGIHKGVLIWHEKMSASTEHMFFDFDQQMFDKSVEAARKMWKHIKTKTPPEFLTAEDWDKYSKSKDTSMEANETMIGIWGKLHDIKKKKEELEKQDKHYRGIIKGMVKTHRRVLHKDQVLFLYFDTSRTNFDKKKFAKQHPEIFEKYTSVVPSRQLLLKSQ
jgi:predicted phage-related endonuclease